MRIVFLDLHENSKMIKILSQRIFRISVARKHRYILDEWLKREDVQICNYITKEGEFHSALANQIYRLLYPCRIIEAQIALKLDKVSASNIKTIFRLQDIHSDDIVIVYSLQGEFSEIEHINGFKVGCLLHNSCGSDFAEKFEKANVQCFYNEADLRKTGEMFRFYYRNLNQPILVIPFVFEDRFRRIEDFSKRKNLAIAVGTIAKREDKEFLEVYKDSCLQPGRKMIKTYASQMTEYYDCVSNEYEEGVTPKTTRPNDNLIKKIYVAIWNYTHFGQQKSYFSFDMVEKFNQYKMAICAEEIIGVPGIGFVESMACGCAYIGCTKYDYAAYGMIEGVHYIGYDGSLEDLKNKIEYYQNHGEELERLAEAGYQFAQNHFTKEAVAQKLLKGILEQQQGYDNTANEGKMSAYSYFD